MRLIDADALEKFLKRLRRELPKESRDFFTRDEMILNFQQYVHMQPTIDAVPVVRGEWIEAKSGVMSVWPEGQVMCSVCGQRMPSQWEKMPPYCYGCGAKMEDKQYFDIANERIRKTNENEKGL